MTGWRSTPSAAPARCEARSRSASPRARLGVRKATERAGRRKGHAVGTSAVMHVRWCNAEHGHRGVPSAISPLRPFLCGPAWAVHAGFGTVLIHIALSLALTHPAPLQPKLLRPTPVVSNPTTERCRSCCVGCCKGSRPDPCVLRRGCGLTVGGSASPASETSCCVTEPSQFDAKVVWESEAWWRASAIISPAKPSRRFHRRPPSGCSKRVRLYS